MVQVREPQVNLRALIEASLKQKNMTKRGLADAVNVSPGYISHIISGNKTPSPTVIAAIAQALELPVDKQRLLWQATGYSSSIGTIMTDTESPRVKTLGPSVLPVGSQEAGIVAAYPELPDNIARQWVSKETKVIRIQDTWIAEDLLTDLEQALEIASCDDVRIEIILLAEDSPAAIQRAHELSKNPFIRKELADDELKRYEESLKRYAGSKIDMNILELERLADYASIVVKKHEAMPHFEVFACDDRALISFFALGGRGSMNPQIEVDCNNTFFGDFVREEFDRRWKEAGEAVFSIEKGARLWR